jgi:hypothetical protein
VKYVHPKPFKEYIMAINGNKYNIGHCANVNWEKVLEVV